MGFALLKQRRFGPLAATQFLGAFHDNLYKNAFVVLLLYGACYQTALRPDITAALAAGIFIAPFLLFSWVAGRLAQRYPRARILQATKLAEILIALCGVFAILHCALGLSLFVLFLFGTHSAIFGPVRYALLPDHLRAEELLAGNALLNCMVFVAILCGTMAGAFFMNAPQGKTVIAGLMIFCAAAGFGTSLLIPRAPSLPASAALLPPPSASWRVLPRGFLTPILGIGWFYFMGSIFLSQLAAYVKTALQADEAILTASLAVFSIGIAVGGFLSSALLKKNISARFAGWALAGMTGFSIDLYTAAEHPPFALWRIMGDLFFIAACGGLFQVPLNAILQHRSEGSERPRLLAFSATVNAVFVLFSSIISALLLKNGWDARALFFDLGLVNGGVALWLLYKRPV